MIRRLSGYDASMLPGETPSLPMTGCALWELDFSTVPGGYSFETFRDRLSERMPSLPEWRMKLADSRWNLDTPVWVDDPAFDLDRHLHRVDLPAPGGRRELEEFIGRLMAQRMNRDRPLWDMWVVEGLAGTDPDFRGHVAVVHRMHHVLADGVSALDILSRLCSTAPDAPPPAARGGVGSVSARRIAVDGLRRFVARPRHLVTTVLPATARGVVEVRRMRRRAGPPVPKGARPPRTPFNGNVSDRRATAFVELDMADVKTVKDRFGSTVNDVILALVSQALRQLLLDRAALPDATLVAMVPVSVFQESRDSRNQLSFMYAPLHTEIADPVDRLEAVTAASSLAKQQASAIGPTLVQDWMQLAPGLSALGLRLYRWSGLSVRRPMYNLTVSNVPGPHEQFYLMGAAVRARYAFGPVFDGAGLNITVMSLNGKLEVGLVSCAVMLPELASLAGNIRAALKTLLTRAM